MSTRANCSQRKKEKSCVKPLANGEIPCEWDGQSCIKVAKVKKNKAKQGQTVDPKNKQKADDNTPDPYDLCQKTPKGTYKRGIKPALVALAQQQLVGMAPSAIKKMAIPDLCKVLAPKGKKVKEEKAQKAEKKEENTLKAEKKGEKAQKKEEKAQKKEEKAQKKEEKAQKKEEKAQETSRIQKHASSTLKNKKLFKHPESLKHAYAKGTCFTRSDPVPHTTCDNIADYNYEDLYNMNNAVLDCLEVLHDKWVSGEDDFALLHANFLVDYYCSKMLEVCEPERFVKTMDDVKKVVLESRGFQWDVEMTYDFFKRKMDYVDGLTAMVDRFMAMRDYVLKELTPATRAAVEQKQWDKVNPNDLFNAIRRVEGRYSTYHASGWGMYRLMNMNTFQGKNLVADKGPCSCICNSLTRSMLLLLLGYPRGKIFTKLEAPKNYLEYRKKQTHWAMACEDVRLKIKQNWGAHFGYEDMGQHKMASSHAFIAYTRDIIYYYGTAASNYQVGYSYNKLAIITDLRNMFDDRLETKLKINARSRQ